MRVFLFSSLLLAACTTVPAAAPQAAPSAPAAAPQAASSAPADLPAVLSGEGRLDCTISAKKNGRQTLALREGVGLEFDVEVSPIVDGVVNQKGPTAGGSYRFTSHLAKPGKGTLAGVGEIDIEVLDTKVNVEMNRYRQAGGAGTELTFSSEDMARRGVYVEFAGRGRSKKGEVYAFRVTLGPPGSGSGGSVQPASNAAMAPIQSKMVVVQAPTTAVVSHVTTTVERAAP
jgi:hypothetical protein